MTAALTADPGPPPRIGVYTDYVYRQLGPEVYGERAFQLFLTGLRPYASRLVLLGRLDPQPGRWHYPVPSDVEFVGLPFYSSLGRPGRALRAMWGAGRRFWRAMDDIDVVWLLGPNPVALLFAVLAAVRRRRVVLGVRQDLPRYVRSRRPGRRLLHLAADVLEWSWQALARRWPVVVVGPDLAERYAHAASVTPISVSLVGQDDLVAPEEAIGRWPPDGELRVLSVGRIDTEKNPLLLADILARLHARSDRWRLIVCGDGPLAAPLAERLAELGLGDAAELRGYVPQGEQLRTAYREADLFLHVSWTEGLPQVLFEAFAAGLPVVATAVGGVPAAAGDAALLVEPGDADEPARALERIAADAGLRERLVQAGSVQVGARTIEAELAVVAGVLGAAALSSARRT